MTGRIIFILILSCTANLCSGQLQEFNGDGKSLKLFVFLSPDCPLSRNYTKTINEIALRHKEDVRVFGIIPGNGHTTAEINEFKKKYWLEFELFADIAMAVTHTLHASITPEVVLLDSSGNTIYAGAIDNWVETLGKNKIKPTRFYLLDAIDQYLSSSMVLVKKTEAVGCKINDY